MFAEYEADQSNFKWLDYYKRVDLTEIDPNIAVGRAPPKNRESKFREELERRKREYTTHEPYK